MGRRNGPEVRFGAEESPRPFSPFIRQNSTFADFGRKGKRFVIAGYDAHAITQGKLTLREVAEMKRICDELLMHAFGKRSQNLAKRER